MTADEINAIADRAAEKTAERILSALGLGGGAVPTPGLFLHSLTCEEFAVCVEHHPEYVRRLIRCRSTTVPKNCVSGKRPYKIDASKVLPLWNVTPSLALARLAAWKKEQSPSPIASPLPA